MNVRLKLRMWFEASYEAIVRSFVAAFEASYTLGLCTGSGGGVRATRGRLHTRSDFCPETLWSAEAGLSCECPCGVRIVGAVQLPLLFARRSRALMTSSLLEPKGCPCTPHGWIMCTCCREACKDTTSRQVSRHAKSGASAAIFNSTGPHLPSVPFAHGAKRVAVCVRGKAADNHDGLSC